MYLKTKYVVCEDESAGKIVVRNVQCSQNKMPGQSQGVRKFLTKKLESIGLVEDGNTLLGATRLEELDMEGWTIRRSTTFSAFSTFRDGDGAERLESVLKCTTAQLFIARCHLERKSHGIFLSLISNNDGMKPPYRNKEEKSSRMEVAKNDPRVPGKPQLLAQRRQIRLLWNNCN